MKQNAPKGFRGFLREKGYYIVLLLCAAAVGTSGYFLLTKSPASPAETAVIAAVSTPSVPASTAPTEPFIPTSSATEETSSPSTQAPRLETAPPVDGEELTAFSADRLAYNVTTRDWRTHEGIDIAVPLNEAVCAAADGTVYTIYSDKSLGMTVVVQHSGGYTTHYSNLNEEVDVVVGQNVSAGDVLGTVGQTATIETATASHLHFAVYKNNVPVDPAEFFAL